MQQSDTPENGLFSNICMSETTYLWVKNKFTCLLKAKVQAKGKGEIDMYYVSKI
jgi:hypothetical protein